MTDNKKNDRDAMLIIQMVILHLHFNTITGYPQMMLKQVSFECVNGKETLRLICRVKDLELDAFIFHNSKEQAFCETYPYVSCEDFEENGNIAMTASGDVVYTFESKKKNFLNGTWACRNGQGVRDEYSSIEVVSTKCEFSSPSFFTTMLPYDNNTINISNNDNNGHSEIDKTIDGLLLLLLPILVFSATVVSLRCCNRAGLLVAKLSCLFAWFEPQENERQRSKTETGFQFCCCFLLFGVYCSSVLSYNYLVIGTDYRWVLLIIVCLFGITVAIFTPLIWQTRRVPHDATNMLPIVHYNTEGHKVSITTCQKDDSNVPTSKFPHDATNMLPIVHYNTEGHKVSITTCQKDDSNVPTSKLPVHADVHRSSNSEAEEEEDQSLLEHTL